MTVSTPCYTPGGELWHEHHDHAGWFPTSLNLLVQPIRVHPKFTHAAMLRYAATLVALLDSGI